VRQPSAVLLFAVCAGLFVRAVAVVIAAAMAGGISLTDEVWVSAAREGRDDSRQEVRPCASLAIQLSGCTAEQQASRLQQLHKCSMQQDCEAACSARLQALHIYLK
jgi:hypothetical protein